MYFFNILENTPLFFYTVLGAIGLLVGSFLNVVILRLPKMLQNSWQNECRLLLELNNESSIVEKPFNLLVPRSQCPNCSHNISALENIPVISYLALAGKCAECKTPISIRYPIIEFSSAVLAIFVAIHFGYGIQTMLAILLTWALLVLSVIDIDHQLLPDDITLPFLWLGILVNMFGVFTGIYSSLIGAMAGYLSLWLVYQGFKLLTGKEGMGYGDFKLFAMLGAWLGWQMLPLIILLASLCGAVIGLSIIFIRKQDKSIPIPFGPYLAIAGWIALIWGNEITGAYYSWALSP